MHHVSISVICASLTGIFYALALTSYLEGIPLGLFAWIALIPLHRAIEGATPRQAFWRGWLTGIVGSVGMMYWVIIAMHQYGQVPVFLSALFMLLLAAYLGVYWGLYGVGIVLINRQWPTLMFMGAPALWVSLEFLRTYLLSGLPWGLLGYSQFRFVPIIQIADFTGVYGLSFLVIQVNVAMYLVGRWLIVLQRHSEKARIPRYAVLAVFVTIGCTWGYGIWQINIQAEMDRTNSTIRIGLIQANIDQAHKWDTLYRLETMRRYANLTTQVAPGMDLIVWPEAATPFLYEQEPTYQAMIASLLQETNIPLVFGSPVLQRHSDGQPYLFNSAYLLAQSGEIIGRYDKQHLVPFGEYIPVRWFLFFLDKLVVGIGDFESGPGPTVFSVPDQSPHPVSQFGVAICYEVIFPNLVRQLAKQGANFLVTITNDAWFGDTVAPYQHFGMVVFRAVENRMAFARAANTGISGFIAPTGEILAATPLFTEQFIAGTIPLRSQLSVYTMIGDVFAWSCVILTMFLLWWKRFSSQDRTT